MSPFENLGKALRWLRQHRGLRQDDVAGAALVNRPMLSAYENDRRQPSLETLGSLLVALDADFGRPPAGAGPTKGPSVLHQRRAARLERRPLSIPARLVIERFGVREIHVSGGDSPHTADRPFVIDLDEVRETAHVLDWMSRIAVRCWGATPADLFTLARLLLDALAERLEPPADA